MISALWTVASIGAGEHTSITGSHGATPSGEHPSGFRPRGSSGSQDDTRVPRQALDSVKLITQVLLLVMVCVVGVRADGVISAKNLGGLPILSEDSLPLPKAVARVEVLDGTSLVAAGQFVRDGYFALGTITIPSPNTSQVIPLRVRCWDSTAGASFDDAVIAGHGFGFVDVQATLTFGSVPPVDLVSDGFQGFQLLSADPVPYWVRFEELLTLPDAAPATPGIIAANKQLFARSSIAAFRIEVTHPVSLSINVQETQFLDPLIRVFDSSGSEVARGDGLNAANSVRTSTIGGFLNLELKEGGRYHLAISSRSNGSYSFFHNSGVVSGDHFGAFELSATRGIHGEVHTANPLGSDPAIAQRPVDLVRFDQPGAPTGGISSWVLIHGWNSSATQSEMLDLATNLLRLRPLDQVLLLDWSEIATTPWTDPYTPAAGVVPIARWVVAALQQIGLDGAHLNFIGHSYGAYIADEVAHRLPGGANSIVALDPAALTPGADGEINFRRDARSSWAFLGSVAGNEATPVTASEAFGVRFATTPNFPNPNLFTVLRNALNGRYYYPNLFLIDRLLDGSHGPFLEDRYSFSFVSEPGTSGYEGILHPDDGTHPLFQWLEIETAIDPPKLSVERHGENFAVKVGQNWSPSNSLFQSTDLKAWTSTFNQRLDFIYTNRVFEIPDTNGATLFFKAQ